jgi:hypothetical protein
LAQSASALHCTHRPGLVQYGVEPLQAVVHDPQWVASLPLRSAHTLPQAVRPVGHTWQAPPMHAAPETHWLAPVPLQLVRHAVVPHTNGLHVCVDTAGQLPAPSQTAAWVAVPLVQLAWRHVVEAPGSVHVAWVPLHVPAQAPLPVHAVWPVRGAPLTSSHVPGVLPLQNWHDPLQAELQQTPSAHWPVMHWVAAVHACPCFRLQAPVASQVCVPLQLSASSAFVIATQAPAVAVQAWQAPHDATLQQTPSTHAPLVHSVAPAQVAPLPFLGTHVPALQ